MANERDFKGIWIPKEIWEDKRLGAIDKILLAEIDSLDITEEGCYASNEYLAEFCQCSPSKVSHSISNLIDYKYLYIKSFDGRKRFLKSSIVKITSQPSKNCKADTQNLQEINIDNNKDNIYSPSKDEQDKSSFSGKEQDNLSEEEQLSENFNLIWKDYPRKDNKNTAYKHYKCWLKGKLYVGRTEKLENKEMWYAVQIYRYELMGEKKEKQFIKMGSTFFNEAIFEYATKYKENTTYWEKKIDDWRNNK